jgi:peptidoglycan hydrolase-like protein with peptidoglycan-binding domain
LEWNEVDGDFGKKTHRAVCSLQAARSLTINGEVDLNTIAALKK